MYARLLRDFDEDILKIENSEKTLFTIRGCLDYAVDFVNILERLTHLHKKKKIPKDTIDYFKNLFPYVLALDKWRVEYEKKYYSILENDRDNSRINFIKYCKSHNIEAIDLSITPFLQIVKNIEKGSA